jgi:tRNA nucleotidyltransferase (CCA-adding enzyme)
VLLIIKYGSFLSNIKKLKYVLQQCVKIIRVSVLDSKFRALNKDHKIFNFA